MKIVSWNCNGGFRGKLPFIIDKKFKYTHLDADIYVIQECEYPKKGDEEFEEYRKFAGKEGKDYFWVGNESQEKGLGIFKKDDGVELKMLEFEGNYEYLIAVRVNDSFNLLTVWTTEKSEKKGSDSYVETIHDFLEENKDNEELFDGTLMMCGDFNSNALFNYKHKVKDKSGHAKNHTNLNKKLKKKGLYSVYHKLSGECSGEETRFTFFQARHLNVPYYLDYFYVNEKIINKTDLITFWGKSRDKSSNYFEILDREEWTNLSDHLPIVLKFEEK